MFPWRYTNWDHPNPVVRRWHFLEALDLHLWVLLLAWLALLGLVLLWNKASYRKDWVRKVVDSTSGLTMLLVLVYLVWRFAFAWKGYYY
jgi:glucan phosphoethanolaminetransferase (alkaline phosphatase superfamily)